MSSSMYMLLPALCQSLCLPLPTTKAPARVEMLKTEVIGSAIEFICDVRREEAEGREADWKEAQWWFVLKQGEG